jgi:hypothetical protein
MDNWGWSLLTYVVVSQGGCDEEKQFWLHGNDKNLGLL